ncbi:peptidyl-tRNA hydrolase ICT1, mitochondrial-like [Panonychus citri]|uniref:peptidyl-tRNA hydrolase ICT1, mitochondrial-like n=1 Tax=Panonychus citri TaxID=50023 RepID=UPI0023071485|nr:peptidyl-tRNA hydrolase ICT1, mitochondrial-like [Panonychus citri]
MASTFKLINRVKCWLPGNSLAVGRWNLVRCFHEVPEFKSDHSLEKIYPNSKLDPFRNVEVSQSSDKFNGYIPVDKLTVTRVRASKPGGQNVNKSNTKVTITFKLSEADWIPEPVRDKLALLHKNSINKEGEWIIRSQKTRTSSLNLADCMDKLRVYITEAEESIPPPEDPVTIEMRRERYEKAAQERLRQKRHRSMVNRMKTYAYHAE